MSQLRFNQVWAGLLGLAGVSAFVVSPAVGDRVKGFAQNMFVPVARPVRVVGVAVREKIVGKGVVDEGAVGGKARTDATIAAENQALRLEVANLSEQVEALRREAGERSLLGAVKDWCTAMAVVGADPGDRESLQLQTTGADHIDVGMPVLFTGGIAGRIASAGSGGSRAQLISDPGFRVQGRFGRFLPNNRYITIEGLLPVAQGAGRNRMVIRNSLTMRQVQDAGLQIGDYFVLSDPDWPQIVQGYKLGRVTEITTQANAPLMAEISIQPAADLMSLNQVMVMNRKP